MSHRGILINKQVVLVDDVQTWARKFEASDRIVCQTHRYWTKVSTVFLGLNHKWTEGGRDLWFETMVFGLADPEQRTQVRYTTWEEAEAGHKKVCEEVFKWGLIGCLLRGIKGKASKLYWRYC